MKCGKRIGIFDAGTEGRCAKCTNSDYLASLPDDITAESDAREIDNLAIEQVLLTTESAPNIIIKERIEIVSAECAFGMNAFKDLFTALRNIVGGRSEAVQKVMRESRKVTLFELKKEAYLAGANAVVGVDLDYVEIGGAGGNMILLVASGTAVIIENQVNQPHSRHGNSALDLPQANRT